MFEEGRTSCPKDRMCTPCGKTFQSRKDRERHLMTRIHIGSSIGAKFKCPADWCCKRGRKGSSRLDNFKGHVLAVHGEEYWEQWSSALVS
jgi:hypothetical protein